MKRTCAMMLRFHRSELDALTKKARKARMSRESRLCRFVMEGC